MSGVRLPEGLRLERLERNHRRRRFTSGERSVDDWLATKALQNQEKHLSVTKVLLDRVDAVVGYYTLAAAQIDFGDLPPDIRKRLPRRTVPVIVIAWLGIAVDHQRRGLGKRLLAAALHDCYAAAQSLPFVAVLVDAVSDEAAAFYKLFEFEELPGQRHRLFISYSRLAAIMQANPEA